MTSSRSTISEIPAPSVLGDFEPGDRVFERERGSFTQFGTVVEVDETSMVVQLSNKRETRVTVDPDEADKDSIRSLSKWKKMPDDALIQVGDIMSTTLPYYVSAPDRREFFTVIEIIPGRKISMRNNDDYKYIVNIQGSLDEYLQYWELEG